MASTYQTGTRPSGATKKSHKSTGSRPTTPKHKKTTVEVVSESEDDMTTSFLHYCATCENQIPMPASTLYCSETCRQKDANSSMSSYAIPRSNPSSPNHSPPFGPVRDIIPQRSPTLRHISSPFLHGLPAATSSSSSLSSSSSSASFRRASQQLDNHTYTRPARSHQDSEAARYLRQFSSTNLSKSSDHPSSRHQTRHTRHATTSTSTIPSLSHTPESNASSFAPHSPTTATSNSRRPSLPHRSSNLTFSKRKSIDLVTPVSALHSATDSYFPKQQPYDDTASPVSTGSDRTITFASLNLKSSPTTAETHDETPSEETKGSTAPSEDESLEWMLQAAPRTRTSNKEQATAKGSLKQFFHFDQMRRAPHS